MSKKLPKKVSKKVKICHKILSKIKKGVEIGTKFVRNDSRHLQGLPTKVIGMLLEMANNNVPFSQSFNKSEFSEKSYTIKKVFGLRKNIFCSFCYNLS